MRIAITLKNYSTRYITLVILSAVISIVLVLSSLILCLKATAATPTNALLSSGDIIADIVEDVSPSVVLIKVEQKIDDEGDNTNSKGDLIDQIFGNSLLKNKMPEIGSGTIMTSDGYILTSYNVIKNAAKITVTTNNGAQYEAKLIGEDKYSDLAVIKISTQNLKPIKLADEKTKVRAGQWAIALGSPYGLNNTVTLGIISAVSREIPDYSDIKFIQTDTAINHGSAGGPLLNVNGETIGINTAIYERAQNISFTVPVAIVKKAFDELKTGNPIHYPKIGIVMLPLTHKSLNTIDIPANAEGVLVSQVVPNSPAGNAGIEQWDIIQNIDGKLFTDPKEIQSYIRTRAIGTEVNIRILRDGKTVNKKIEVGK